MNMEIHLKRWGNSLGLRIPKGVADAVGLKADDVVSIDASPDGFVVRKARRKYDLAELLGKVTAGESPRRSGLWRTPRQGTLVKGKAPGREATVVHLDFNPQAGHEQAGSRFGLVLSPPRVFQCNGVCFRGSDHQSGQRLSF